MQVAMNFMTGVILGLCCMEGRGIELKYSNTIRKLWAGLALHYIVTIRFKIKVRVCQMELASPCPPTAPETD